MIDIHTNNTLRLDRMKNFPSWKTEDLWTLDQGFSFVKGMNNG